MTEQRYKAVLAVIGDGRTVGEVARDWGVSTRTMHRWLARYEGEGFEGLGDRSHRPDCLHPCPYPSPFWAGAGVHFLFVSIEWPVAEVGHHRVQAFAELGDLGLGDRLKAQVWMRVSTRGVETPPK